MDGLFFKIVQPYLHKIRTCQSKQIDQTIKPGEALGKSDTFRRRDFDNLHHSAVGGHNGAPYNSRAESRRV